jgi:hypothetical protein
MYVDELTYELEYLEDNVDYYRQPYTGFTDEDVARA